MNLRWESTELLALGTVHGLVNLIGALSSSSAVRVKWAFQAILLVVFCTDAVTLSYMA
eukprot:CAMPEP_0179020406 /NCGR_PEP_ID=MMETSP0796-20121207/5362_1 /TAXON_ID=73915 /ORGANISM="Pyrodinium bahamense, Strain pbaha01" /LENGTH=57 /DNA_ID=CAMNT_0020716213 /DNA_START=118 /DNA_END=287 /DNA_ORIENTATION=-